MKPVMDSWKAEAGRVVASIRRRRNRKPQGHRGIEKLGHREYVGGLWEEMGRLQIDFLVEQGLKPSDVLLDIGCGSLRGGVHFIAYLDAGNYLGIEKEQELIDLGVEYELGDEVFRARRPELVASDSFEFERFSKRPTFALAQSLFTHLTPAHVDLCLAKLRAFVPGRCRFFATFFERGPSAPANPKTDHDHSVFSYTRDEMRAFGDAHDWRFRYIGDWRHPRGQVMVEYVTR